VTVVKWKWYRPWFGPWLLAWDFFRRIEAARKLRPRGRLLHSLVFRPRAGPDDPCGSVDYKVLL